MELASGGWAIRLSRGRRKRALEGASLLIRERYSRLVYFLPILHLCACFISMLGHMVTELQCLGIVMTFIMILDLPISLVAYGLAWKHGVLAGIWILTAGTLWWYLLSLGVKFVFGKFTHRRKRA